MKRLLNFGSINIDYVYQVSHFLRAGETLEASQREIFMGGKGLNQTIAAIRSGLTVSHAGVLGTDGQFLFDFIEKAGVDTAHLKITNAAASGHTVIQVTPEAENAILYFAGTNHLLSEEAITNALNELKPGDFVLTQNEMNNVAFILKEAKARGLMTVFNPAPYTREVLSYPLDCVDAFIVNETEAQGIVNTDQTDENYLLDQLRRLYPNALLFLTLGARGMSCDLPGKVPLRLSFDAYRVKAVDATGAGDTFVGYALRAIMAYFEGCELEAFKNLLNEAMLAAALSVTRKGAVPSIPTIEELTSFKKQFLG